MAIIQPIIDLVEICAFHGVENAILCPGSRSAAITMAFVRNPKINCYSISDERSAGFIAIGMALKTKRPTVIVCTSGSAVYNFAPAVAEAFFQQIPLIVISADRPLEWIHQNDGQTIYQQDIFGKNCKKSYNLLADINHSDTNWYYQRVVNEAVNLSEISPKGPVHINIPIREPFYPMAQEAYIPSLNIKFIEFTKSGNELLTDQFQKFANEFLKAKKVLIAVGQREVDIELDQILIDLQQKLNIPILADIISNVQIEKIYNHDMFLDAENDSFKPDILLTFGQSFISKAFKKYFQKNKVNSHWHIQEHANVVDPLQSISEIIISEPKEFLLKMLQLFGGKPFDKGYLLHLTEINSIVEAKKVQYFNKQLVFAEIQAYKITIENLPSNIGLHLANSMAVRYVNILGINQAKIIEIHANRGTSGIDGCLSTAVGAALKTDKLVYLFIGDVAFFYDRNALWNNYLPNNLRIVVFNNAGGGIFRLIDGPSKQPELEEFFETKQNYSAKATVLDSDLEYFEASNFEDLKLAIKNLNSNKGRSKCLEIFTSGELNQTEFKAFMSVIKG